MKAQADVKQAVAAKDAALSSQDAQIKSLQQELDVTKQELSVTRDGLNQATMELENVCFLLLRTVLCSRCILVCETIIRHVFREFYISVMETKGGYS